MPASDGAPGWLWYVGSMERAGTAFDVTCPHCRKQFTGEVIGEGAQQGFKCPHCKLFVPFERADDNEDEEPPAPV